MHDILDFASRKTSTTFQNTLCDLNEQNLNEFCQKEWKPFVLSDECVHIFAIHIIEKIPKQRELRLIVVQFVSLNAE